MSKKLFSNKYNHVISESLSEMTGCLINISSKDISKNHITIRTYCGHGVKVGGKMLKCKRTFKLINKNVESGSFIVFTNGASPFHPYKKARIISGYKREEMKANLLHSTPNSVREKLDQTNPPTHDVLRQIRSESLRDQDNDSNNFADIKIELMKQKRDIQTQFIQRLSIDPSCVCMWSDMQIDILKRMGQTEEEIVLFMDATGGISQSLEEDCNKKQTMLNNAVVLPLRTFKNQTTDPFPVTEMLSGNNDHDTIGNLFILIHTNLFK